MHYHDYTILNQTTENDVDNVKGHVDACDGNPSSPSVYSSDQAPRLSDLSLTHYNTFSSRYIVLAILALTLVNLSCFFITTRHLSLAAIALKQYLGGRTYHDTRELPRPDPYDGL